MVEGRSERHIQSAQSVQENEPQSTTKQLAWKNIWKPNTIESGMFIVAFGKGGNAYPREPNENTDDFKPQVLLVWGVGKICESCIPTL